MFEGRLPMLNAIKGLFVCPCSSVLGIVETFYQDDGGYDQDCALRGTVPARFLPSVHGRPKLREVLQSFTLTCYALGTRFGLAYYRDNPGWQ